MTTTATKSRTAAIRQARSEVALVRTAPVSGGYAGARVNEYDAGRGAWVQGTDQYLAAAQATYKSAVVRRALRLLGWEDYDAKAFVERESWTWGGRRVEKIVRAYCAEAP